ncbi:MAG TPA: hypothetical protein VK165_19305 [Azonexus sp.]|nr:hypothetical protein [Azonexus sp.]
MDTTLIAFLLAAAVRITGLPAVPVEELPTFVALAPSELERQVCPDGGNGCKGIAAYFDALHYRILYRDTLDLEQPLDHSFLLHEIVHVLQHRQVGNAMYADCRATLRTEAQAYRAQNAYLRTYDQWAYVGVALNYAACPG